MKSFLWLLLLSVLVLPATVLAQTDEQLVSFEGFDYEDPDDNPAEFGAQYDWYRVVGYLQSANPAYLTTNFTDNEYTIYFFNLWSQGFTDFGCFRFVNYTDGRVRMFEDSKAAGTHGVFGTNPPNATSPSTFIDGTLMLGGMVTGFGITLDLCAKTGSFSGDVKFDEGAQLAGIPPNTSRVYTFAGLTAVPTAQVPEGYDHQASGRIRIERVVPGDNTTWGRMKALYR